MLLANASPSETIQSHIEARPPRRAHVELLNLLARAAGSRNFAVLKADPPPAPVELATLNATARKTLMQFDAQRRLVRLPNKLSVQQLAMWAFWTHFAVRRNYTEKEVNAILNAHHTFGDPATLRREMVEMQLLGRESDCRRYWKEPKRPDADARAFLQAWRAKFRSCCSMRNRPRCGASW